MASLWKVLSRIDGSSSFVWLMGLSTRLAIAPAELIVLRESVFYVLEALKSSSSSSETLSPDKSAIKNMR